MRLQKEACEFLIALHLMFVMGGQWFSLISNLATALPDMGFLLEIFFGLIFGTSHQGYYNSHLIGEGVVKCVQLPFPLFINAC